MLPRLFFFFLADIYWPMMTLIFFYGKGRGEEEEEEVDRTIGTIGTKEAKRNNYRQIAEKVSSRDQTRPATAYIHRDRKRERLPQHQTGDDKKREKKKNWGNHFHPLCFAFSLLFTKDDIQGK